MYGKIASVIIYANEGCFLERDMWSISVGKRKKEVHDNSPEGGPRILRSKIRGASGYRDSGSDTPPMIGERPGDGLGS